MAFGKLQLVQLYYFLFSQESSGFDHEAKLHAEIFLENSNVDDADTCFFFKISQKLNNFPAVHCMFKKVITTFDSPDSPIGGLEEH